jgi:hypothetical protein
LCAGDGLRLRVTLFAPRINPGAIGQMLRGLTGELSAEDVAYSTLARDDSTIWRLATTTVPDRLVAFAEWIDGAPAQGGMAQRMTLAWHSVFGARAAPLMVTMTESSANERLSEAQRRQIRTAMEAVLAANPQLTPALLALSRQAGDIPSR